MKRKKIKEKKTMKITFAGELFSVTSLEKAREKNIRMTIRVGVHPKAPL